MKTRTERDRAPTAAGSARHRPGSDQHQPRTHRGQRGSCWPSPRRLARRSIASPPQLEWVLTPPTILPLQFRGLPGAPIGAPKDLRGFAPFGGRPGRGCRDAARRRPRYGGRPLSTLQQIQHPRAKSRHLFETAANASRLLVQSGTECHHWPPPPAIRTQRIAPYATRGQRPHPNRHA